MIYNKQDITQIDFDHNSNPCTIIFLPSSFIETIFTYKYMGHHGDACMVDLYLLLPLDCRFVLHPWRYVVNNITCM